MKRRWCWIVVGICSVVILVGIVGTKIHKDLFGEVIPSHIPEGVHFQPQSQVDDWEIDPALKMLRDPANPTEGLAVVKIVFTSKVSTQLEDVQAAIFLPDALYEFTPMVIFGTNQQKSHMTVSPSQPQFIIGNTIHFPDYAKRDTVRRAFEGMTRVKISWKGGERYIEFPFSHWQVEIEGDTP